MVPSRTGHAHGRLGRTGRGAWRGVLCPHRPWGPRARRDAPPCQLDPTTSHERTPVNLARLLDIQEGEGRTGAALFFHLFFVTAAAIVLSAAKNGLFLSAYPARLIPHVIVASSLTTAAFSILFLGLAGRWTRTRLVQIVGAASAVAMVAARWAFLADPRTAFLLYLLLSIVGALVVALAWSSVADILTGRQSRRLMPLLIGGTSAAGITTGFGVAPAAEAFGTPNLLLAAGAAILVGVLALRMTPAATRAAAGGSAGADFLARVKRGTQVVRRHRLIALVAAGLVLSMLIATLVDYQFKAFLQQSYDRDAITSVFGLLAGAVGIGTLVLQALASRILFRRYGLVAGPFAQAALVGAAAVGVAATGWLGALALLRFVDETSRFTLQKTVEQVSLSPFPPEVRNPAFTLLGGVLKPLSQAATGLVLVLLAPLLGVRGLALLTAMGAAALFGLFRRYPPLYRAALEDALARHTLSLGGEEAGALAVMDRAALEAIDRALAKDDPAIVLFALSLLRNTTVAEAAPRLRRLLDHDVPEVRAEAARTLVELVGPDGDREELEGVRAMLRDDASLDVVREILSVADIIGGPDTMALVADRLRDADPSIRREAVRAAARSEARHGRDRCRELVADLLAGGNVEDRTMALDAVGILGDERFLPAAFAATADPATRTPAVTALAAFGDAGLPWIERVLTELEPDESDLRTVASILAEAGSGPGLERLLGLAEERMAVAAVLPPMQRARRNGTLRGLSAQRMRRVVRPSLVEGTRYGILADALETSGSGPAILMEELQRRQHTAAEAVLSGLALTYDPEHLERAGPHLRSRNAAARSSALELLDGLLHPDDRDLVIPFFEGLQAPARLRESARELDIPGDALARDPLGVLEEGDDDWLRSCALFIRHRRGDRNHNAPREDSTMLPLMEIVFFLKSSSLFRPLPGEELARVARVAETVHLEQGEILFNQGDPGDAFYMVVSGAVGVERGTRQIAVLGPHEGLGEMALLDGEPRSATVRAVEACTLLRIDQPSFDSLVDRSPALAKGIYRSLCGRLRNTLEQVNE